MSVFTGTELSHEMGMVGLMVSGMSGVSRMANIMNEIITFCSMGHTFTHPLWIIDIETWNNIYALQYHLSLVVLWLKGKIWHNRVVNVMLPVEH